MPAATLAASIPPTDMAIAMAGPTVGALFRDAARRGGEAPALFTESATVSYGALNERVNRLTSALQRQGLKAGDRIAIVSENRAEYVELILACAKGGFIAACQNWRQAAPEIAHCIALVEPRLIFASPRHAGIVKALDIATPIIELGSLYETFLKTGNADEPQIMAAAENGLLILYTSGTTGMPKGALISHRALVARSMVMTIDWSIRPSDGSIAWTPFYHMASADPAISALIQGAPVFIVDGFNPQQIAKALSWMEVGWFVLMPGMIERMIDALKVGAGTVRRIAGAGCMANLVPPQQIAEISQLLNAPFLNSFGATETGIAPASGMLIPAGVRPSSFSKRQTSFCDVRLVDEEDREVAIGEVGEMSLRSPTLFSGYWNAPEATAREFRGGWYHMGDDFIRNADGTLDFIDRRKYLIKSGGENIYPAEIERQLLMSSRIAEAVVVRQPDDSWGEIPVAFVVPRDPTLTAEAVAELLRDRIARYKMPKRILLVSEADLQRNTTGKVQRQPLEQRLRDEIATRRAP